MSAALDAPAPPSLARLLPARTVRSAADHRAVYGPLPVLSLPDLVAVAAAGRLNGRGGGGFPLSRKISAVGAAGGQRRSVIVLNAAEGDPTTTKDRALLARVPHLVLDGVDLLATALAAGRIFVATKASGRAGLTAALAERRMSAEILDVPDGFVSSEASALVRLASTGQARPLGRVRPIWEHGVGGAPTLVANVETMAALALLARFGPGWFGELGTAQEPGTTLVTVSGAVGRPGVIETAWGTPLSQVLAAADGPARGFALVGGLAGGWLDLAAHRELPYTSAALRAAGASRGVGSIVVLPEHGCVLHETARILEYLGQQSARQCGPCFFGLPAVASDMASLAAGDQGALDRLQRRLPVISGRGGCAHPDGAVALASSALRVLHRTLRGHLEHHLRGGSCRPPAVVPLGGAL